MNISHPLPPHPAAVLAERLEGILASIALLLFGRIPFIGDLAARLHNRFGRARRRLALLLTALAAGHQPRIYQPRPGQESGPRAQHLSRRHAWLVRLFGYHIAGYGSQLQFLLHDPETLATLAAAPPRTLASAGRALRPLARMLGITLPPLLQPPPRPAPLPKPAKSPAPPKPPLPALRPLYPRRYAREMPPLLPPPKIRPT